MTHSIIRVGTGKVQWEGLEPFQSKIKVRDTQRIRYFIKENGKKIGLSESLALDPNYKPDKQRFREVRTKREVQYENILNTGEKVWWNPTGNTKVVLNNQFRKPDAKLPKV